MNQAALHRLLAGETLGGTLPASAREALFAKRLAANATLLKDLFFSLYPESHHRETFIGLMQLLQERFRLRPVELQRLDLERLNQGNWYQSEHWVGMQLYVDRFSGDLKGLEEKLPYFEALGINFLHLMPITRRPSGPNDGGYAVNSYTEVDPAYGSEQDLARLTKKFRQKGICLMLDFVVNHTSDEFPWAVKAREGDPEFQGFYYTYPDRSIPDLFEQSLPEVFPETSPGNFTYDAQMQRWVMTVFNSYQWDLNYTNPRVFLSMLENLLALCDKGVDVVRFDALAFLWKKPGTDSQNLPEAHRLIALFRLCLQVVAPGVAILAEAIVAPHEIVKYFGEGALEGNECEIAYHATFMACLWNSVATRKTLLLQRSLNHMPRKPSDGTWINYVRCHDDIGLGFDNAHIAALGWDPGAHRRFLLDYFGQRLSWSPAKGAVFMYNPTTGDGRITGSTASLLGLEKGMEQGDEAEVHRAISKILLLYGIVLASPGIPLVYAGDEIGMLNDYSYMKDPKRAGDSRWMNRPLHDWDAVEQLGREHSPASQIYSGLQHLIRLRKQYPVLADRSNQALHPVGNDHLFVFERKGDTGEGLLVIANFDDQPQVINASWLAALGYVREGAYHNLIDGSTRQVRSGLLETAPFELLWISRFI
ncbi:amylosucrase [Robiginitalea marina]|uniref:Alpha-amylase family protein n=1 Tax=Robiginitalea marina TaxID=2954105 RepID=A0ABT1AYI4_9FLAO|nr:amylosucrase [Robiginitalea marina]MCO5724433.1 alpha-amylase family protein [Robiginitalea marina]